MAKLNDLRADMVPLWREVTSLPSGEGARAISFMGLRDSDDAVSAAASFSLLAAERAARTAWLVDLDIRRNPAFWGFDQKSFARLGEPGKPYDASLGKQGFYTVEGRGTSAEPLSPRLLTAHRIGGTRLLVTRFRTEDVEASHRLKLQQAPEWWATLRRSTDWVVVSAPSFERSRAGLAAVPYVDGVVIVVNAERAHADDIRLVRQAVESAEGRVLGLVLTGAKGDSRFFDRLFG